MEELNQKCYRQIRSIGVHRYLYHQFILAVFWFYFSIRSRRYGVESMCFKIGALASGVIHLASIISFTKGVLKTFYPTYLSIHVPLSWSAVQWGTGSRVLVEAPLRLQIYRSGTLLLGNLAFSPFPQLAVRPVVAGGLQLRLSAAHRGTTLPCLPPLLPELVPSGSFKP